MAESAEILFSDATFLAVPVSSLIHRKTAIADMFVRLTTDRMVRVAAKGAEIDSERIHRYGEKNVRHLYVYKIDLSDIVSDLVRGAEGLNQIKNVPSDLRIAKFFSIAESVYQELMQLPITDESLGRAIRLSTEISDSMREKPDFTKLLGTVVSLGDEFTRHSLGTVVMANMIMVQLKWKAQKVVQPVTMGAFFHDIGLKELPRELLEKNPVEMSQAETQLWQTHSEIGVRLLNPIPFVTPDVLRIVQEHHELANGAGYPQRLRGERIFPLARLVSMANSMAHDVFKTGAAASQPFSMEMMAQKVEHVYATMYGGDLAKAARRIFKKEDDA
ncbi:MAG: HD domain-containing protein [Bdellovibrionales bacterium]|nr:HD domain-containing protein [Bdellovibrionales bacterium]